MIRLLIADDHLMFRQGLRRLLADEPDFHVVAEASNAGEVMDAVRNHTIDVAILDLNMPGRCGSDMIGQVKAKAEHTRILVLTMYSEEAQVLAALRAGASGYMTKEEAADELAAVIRKLAHGGRHVCQQVAEKLAFCLSGPDEDKPPHSRLTPRELRVLELVARGKRGLEIAAELSLSEKTVSAHKANLLKKLNLHNNAELVLYAVNHGLNSVLL